MDFFLCNIVLVLIVLDKIFQDLFLKLRAGTMSDKLLSSFGDDNLLINKAPTNSASPTFLLVSRVPNVQQFATVVISSLKDDSQGVNVVHT